MKSPSLALLSVFGFLLISQVCASDKPNVILIVCDDLNDYVDGMGGHPQARTPNMARLAQSGVSFHHAYSNNQVCAPSRASFLTGIYAQTSGNLFWGKWYQNPVLKNSHTLMEYFGKHGYHTVGTGKMMHHAQKDVWKEWKHNADYGPFVFDGKKRIAHPSVPAPFDSIGPVDGSYASLDDVPFADDDDPKTGWIYGTWGKTRPLRYRSATDRDPTPDERNALWVAKRIEQFAKVKKSGGDARPFFLGVGFIRPHTPLHVPQKYFDLFPLDQVQLPVTKKDDSSDTHYKDHFPADQKGLRYHRLLNESYPTPEHALRAFTQAYLASVAAVDDCIGQVLDALDASPFKDNTVVVLTSDHGWNMGEKDYLFKNSPWEESCRIPFIIRAPGITKPGGIAKQPISLIDLYPTLTDLCGISGDNRKNEKGAMLDGHSVRPFLADPENGIWDGPDAALSMIFVGESNIKTQGREYAFGLKNQHWSIRTEHYRYIRYNNGSEELYDHRTDPQEWNNIANSPEHVTLKVTLGKKMDDLIRR